MQVKTITAIIGGLNTSLVHLGKSVDIFYSILNNVPKSKLMKQTIS